MPNIPPAKSHTHALERIQGTLGARPTSRFFSKSCSFQAIWRDPLFWANFGLRAPLWGQNSTAPPDQILEFTPVAVQNITASVSLLPCSLIFPQQRSVLNLRIWSHVDPRDLKGHVGGRIPIFSKYRWVPLKPNVNNPNSPYNSKSKYVEITLR